MTEDMFILIVILGVTCWIWIPFLIFMISCLGHLIGEVVYEIGMNIKWLRGKNDRKI